MIFDKTDGTFNEASNENRVKPSTRVVLSSALSLIVDYVQEVIQTYG